MLSSVATAFGRKLDAIFGRGAYSVAVPPMDGPLLPNNDLEQANSVLRIPAPDNLVVMADEIVFSSGSRLMALSVDGAKARLVEEFGANISALTALRDGGVALGLADGRIVFRAGAKHGREISASDDFVATCPTALLAVGDSLIVAQGSAVNGPDQWRRDLIDGGMTGSVWRLDMHSEAATFLAGGLAYPNGLAALGDGSIAISESWKHRIVKVTSSRTAPEVVLEHLPGYPSRLCPAKNGGYWLAIFAPRNSLVEFVLQESDFKRRMMAEISEDFWVAPCLSSGKSFKEPLQSGGIKTMGLLKPWAPTRSSGLIVLLDQNGTPITSHHSRSDGQRHGITSVVELENAVYVASKGGDEIISFPSRTISS